MAAARRRAWTWRWWWVSSTDRGAGAGDSLHPTPGHPNRRSDLVESSNNFGSGYTTGTTLSINTHTTTSSDRVLEYARVFHHPSVFVPTPPAVVQEKAEEEELDQARGNKFLEEERAKTREHIRVLVRGARGMDRWLSELRVGWVLNSGEVLDASARRRFQCCAEGWILAVYVISRSISSFNGWCCPQEEAAVWPPASELVRFVVATLLKMLPFVDTVVTLNTTMDNPTATEHPTVSCYGGFSAVPPADKFQALVDVRDALSRVSERAQLWASWLDLSADVEAARRISEISCILLAELGKLDEAIWDTRRHIGNRIMTLLMDDDGDSPWRARAHQRSADIHKATRSIMSYINALSTSYDMPGIPTATQPKNMSPLTDLIMEMVHSLEEKIERKSLSFHDHSLKFLFLINNSYFMWQQLHANRLLRTTALTLKIDDYIKSYVQVSWTPVMKCLHNNRAPPCCFTVFSPLHRFESEFQKTYRAQKLWKVPDPKLRKRLRKAVIEEVVPGITEFLEDNSSISNPEVSPEKLEEMLEELFEG
ncbi:unnamed protein product [Urochloa decumbens]|uniref:Exocyst subunit Exo70 family protein n=1 Tax=Urochloa decumbens TaxID=240449 RepID=A0ABC8ZV51_9POAL